LKHFYIWRNFIGLSDFRLYPGDTNVCEIILTSRRSIRKRHPNLTLTSSCRLGVALSMVFIVSVVVILCSSTSDAQNVFANEEWFLITRAQTHRYARVAKYVPETHIFAGERTGVDFMHANRVDGYAYSKSLLANTVCPGLPPLTRGSRILCLGTDKRIPPKTLPYISPPMIVFDCVSLSYHVPFVK